MSGTKIWISNFLWSILIHKKIYTFTWFFFESIYRYFICIMRILNKAGLVIQRKKSKNIARKLYSSFKVGKSSAKIWCEICNRVYFYIASAIFQGCKQQDKEICHLWKIAVAFFHWKCVPVKLGSKWFYLSYLALMKSQYLVHSYS